MDTKFNGTTVETNGVRTLEGGGTGATTAEQARINLGLGSAATADASAYASSAQGAKADTALQSGGLTPYRTSAAQDTLDAGKVASTTTGITGAGAVLNMVSISQADYDAATKNSQTLYIIM